RDRRAPTTAGRHKAQSEGASSTSQKSRIRRSQIIVDAAAGVKLRKAAWGLDVNGDDFVAANDALDVTNEINCGREGRGEQVRSSDCGVEGTVAASHLPVGSEAHAALMMLLL